MCRPDLKAATLLPAVSLRKKGGVLGWSGICRILPFGDSGSAVKNREPPTRPRFYASATCGFVTKIASCSKVFDISLHFRNHGSESRVLATLTASATTSSYGGRNKLSIKIKLGDAHRWEGNPLQNYGPQRAFVF